MPDLCDSTLENQSMEHELVLSLLVATARTSANFTEDPSPGDLVVETTGFQFPPDPDAIGWLVGHGDAPLHEDGTGEVREVWDVRPLSGRDPKGVGYLRWENADFRKFKIAQHMLNHLKVVDGGS